MIKFILGLMIGGIIGLITTCLCVVSKESDLNMYQVDITENN